MTNYENACNSVLNALRENEEATIIINNEIWNFVYEKDSAIHLYIDGEHTDSFSSFDEIEDTLFYEFED